MKTFKPILLTLFTLLTFLITAQDVPNFYTIKAELDSYYDSLIQIRGIDSMQGTGYKPFKRWVGYWEPRIYPHGDFVIERQEFEQYCNDFISGNQNLFMAEPIDWDFIGPDSMPQGSKTWAKGLGQIHFIAFDPNDNTNQKMFACSPVGGLWRSIDGGNSWFNAGTDHELPLCGVSSIAIDPEDSDTHWFISTGNGEAMPGRMWWQNSTGVWRTTNGGNDWEMIGLENIYQMRKIILMRYQNNVNLLAATTDGLYECEDALSSNPQWHKRIDGNFYDVEADPQYSSIAYASGTSSNTSIYRIDIINNIYSELPDLSNIPNEAGRRLIIETSPAAPDYLFIVATYWQGINSASLYRYQLSSGEILFKGVLPQAYGFQPGVGPERAMGWTISPVLNQYDELIMVHGNTAPIRLTSNLLDAEPCNWTDVTSNYGNCEIHVDMHYMVFEHDGQTLWVGSDGGVYKSTMPELINNWEEKCNGLAIAKVFHHATSDDILDIALSGAFDCGANFYQRDNHNPWIEEHVKAGDGYECLIDWINPYRMIVSRQYGYLGISLDGGNSWYSSYADLIFEAYFVQNNTNPDILYGVSYNGVRKSDNFGSSWYDIFDIQGINNECCWRVINSPTHENIVYTSWCGNDASQGEFQKVFKTETGGTIPTDWEDVGSPLINKWINSIAVDYFDPHHIWVSAKQYVYDVNTITKQWTDISNGIPEYCTIEHLEILKGTEGVLYACTNYGVYYYDASLGYWQYIPDNLPNAQIKDIQINNKNNRISVALFGRGIWEADLPCLGGDQVITITSDETWDSFRRIEGMVYIEPDATLVIENTRINLGTDTKIIIKPGGSLILDGCRLSDACNKMWRGIEVWGNKDLHQFEIDGVRHQGYLRLTNGAIVENAETAIRLWEPDNWSSMGGVVVASGATFINNNKAVEFMDYQNYHPYSGNPWPNLSSFTNCTFITDDNYNEITGNFKSFITLWKVDGIRLYGCSFEERREEFQEPFYSIYNIGINSIDANYYILPDCDYAGGTGSGEECPSEYIDSTYFSGLNMAIKAGQAETNNSIYVNMTNFINNVHGIYNYVNDYTTCIKSSFEVGIKQEPPILYIPIGIYNYVCTDFVIEENSFSVHSEIPYGVTNTTGIWTFQAGEDVNIIYKNYFKELYYANYGEGDNHHNSDPWKGLLYECNSNSDNHGYDFYIIRGEGIASYQGSPDISAGNTFSLNTTPLGSDFCNAAVWEVFYYGPPEPVNEIGITYQQALNINSCPSNHDPQQKISQEQKQTLFNQYFANKTLNDQVKTNYIDLIDGGDTKALLLEINNSSPINTKILMQKLLSFSPFLSEDVLIAAADKTDVFPHVNMFVICMANPEEMRNNDFLKYLAEKDDPMPQEYIDQLREQAHISTQKTDMQLEMAHYERQMGDAMNKLIIDIVLDTNGIHHDSLRIWLNNKQNIHAEYKIVDSYMQQKNYISANAHLENILVKYELTEDQLIEYSYFSKLKNILINVNQDNRNIFLLDSIEVEHLTSIAENSEDIAGAQACNILSFVYGFECNSIPQIVDPLKRGRDIDNNENLSEKKLLSYLEIYPNPANNQFLCNYNLPISGEGLLVIYDISGKIIENIRLDKSQGQVVWNTQKINQGMYFMHLKQNNVIYDSQKVLIVK